MRRHLSEDPNTAPRLGGLAAVRCRVCVVSSNPLKQAVLILFECSGSNVLLVIVIGDGLIASTYLH
jgi:hypothetical protein